MEELDVRSVKSTAGTIDAIDQALVEEVEQLVWVETEALTAVRVAALTVYDRCKAVDRVMTVERIRLEE